MEQLKDEIEKLASNLDYKAKSRKFLEMDRWIGKNPVLMVIDAAGTSTGQNYLKTVKPQVEEFKNSFFENEKVRDLTDLSQLDVENQKFKDIFSHERKRRISVEIAKKLVENKNADGDLKVLKRWSEEADPYNYEEDPIGNIDGVGLRTFQYLRMNAGVDSVKPDTQVQKFLNYIEEKLKTGKIKTNNDIEALKSCEWICKKTDLRMIDVDQIAWWHFSKKDSSHHDE